MTAVNDAPVATAPANQTVSEGGTASISAAFTDVDGGAHTCQVNWGEGAPVAGLITQNAGGTSGTCTASHVYADDNPSGTSSDNYTVKRLTVTGSGHH